MTYKNILFSGLIFALLQGCGGSSDDASNTNPESSLDTKPTTQLKLTGTLANSSFFGEQVSISINGEVFSSNSDTQGNFAITLTADESLHDAVVIAETKAIQGALTLRSNLGTLESLLEKAGAPLSLSANDFPGLALSSMTSAKARLLDKNVADGSVSDKSELATALNSFRVRDLFEYATANELVIRYHLGEIEFELPEDKLTSDNLFNDEHILQSLLYQARQSDLTLFEKIESEIKEKIRRVSPSSLGANGQFYFYGGSGFYSPASGAIFKMNSDGSGEWQNDELSVSVSWKEEGDYLILTPDTREVFTKGFAVHEIDSDGSEVYLDFLKYWEGARLSLIEQIGSEYVVEVVETYTDEYFDGDKSYPELNQSLEEVSIIRGISETHLLKAHNLISTDIEYSFGIPEVNAESTSRNNFISKLNSDSTVLVPAAQGGNFIEETANWSIDNSVLTIQVQNGDKLEYRFISTLEEGGVLNVFVKRFNSEGVLNASKYSRIVKRSEPLSWPKLPMVIASGRYFDDFMFSRNWVELNENGEALRVVFSDANANGLVDENEIYTSAGLWQESSSKLSINWYIKETGEACLPESIELAETSGCLVRFRREYDLLYQTQIDGVTRVYAEYSWQHNRYEALDYWSFQSSHTQNNIFELLSARPFDIN